MKKGFTVIELIFVVVILGILVSVGMSKHKAVQEANNQKQLKINGDKNEKTNY